MTLNNYINTLNKRYQSGQTTEHSFRGDLQSALESILPEVRIINEPKRQACGAPDYIVMQKDKDIPIGYIEAKDVGLNLKDKKHQEQFNRYKDALQNLIITDYLSFEFYFEGILVNTLHLGSIQNNQIIANPADFEQFTLLMKDFVSKVTQTLKNPESLAKMMANKAKMLANIIQGALHLDENHNDDSDLMAIFKTFQDHLIHDLNFESFADVYSQTIAYGMFAARYHDASLENFSRQEAAELIPHSNPFLRKLFGHIAGIDLDDRIVWVVEELVKIFQATDVKSVMENFGKSTRMQDPIIHFYETFLAEYDPSLRKARGVWYTPKPVVSFIVRAVDQILKTQFKIAEGLADTQKITIKQDTESKTKSGKAILADKEIHRVQILDPATGTGTFLNEVVRHVYQDFEGMGGMWSQYVEEDLIPRLNGFELLMASYAMAHLKMDMLLTETGYVPSNKKDKNQRFRIFLTNSLEEHHADTGTLFANWLSVEANEANRIKRDTPVMVILGNPPYSVSSSNKSDWILGLINDYKKDLNEKKINLDDDYIKFIRYGQHFIDKNNEGVLAYISNNSFIDGITHRQMRKHLLESFDEIYILDLHGNARRKETCLDGSADQNVFDIMAGVSINIFVKTGKLQKGELGKVFHYDLQGKRDFKYEFLNTHEIKTIPWQELNALTPSYFFVPKDFELQTEYDDSFKLDVLFSIYNSGVKTDRDSLFIDEDKGLLEKRFELLLSGDYSQKFKGEYKIENSGSFKLIERLKHKVFSENFIQKTLYRPFDFKYIYYDPKLVSRPAYKAMVHISNRNNLGLIVGRQGQVVGESSWNLLFATNQITDYNLYYRGGGIVFPLYLYSENALDSTRIPNLNMDIVKAIEASLGLSFTPEKTSPSPSTRGEFLLRDRLGLGADLKLNSKNDLNNPMETTDKHTTKYKNSPLVEGLGEVSCGGSGEVSCGSASFKAEPLQGADLKLNSKNDLNNPTETTDKHTTKYKNSPCRVQPSCGGAGEAYITANPKTYALIKKMRDVLKNNPTKAEETMWEYLRNNKTGYKIRRQHIIENFVADFICLSKKVVIEIDGKIHLNQQEYDALRTEKLTQLGYEIIRFKNEDVFDNPQLIADQITQHLDAKQLTIEISEDENDTFAPIDLLDYIYAVLHSPNYREMYKEFLKIDFPRVPYPKDQTQFWHLVELGGELRQYHLMEHESLKKPICRYPNTGSNQITRKMSKADFVITDSDNQIGQVWINEDQYFDNVPKVAWEFYIGGYQPAQKWLKDRKEKVLTLDDIRHYFKIIGALVKTSEIMEMIDEVLV